MPEVAPSLKNRTEQQDLISKFLDTESDFTESSGYNKKHKKEAWTEFTESLEKSGMGFSDFIEKYKTTLGRDPYYLPFPRQLLFEHVTGFLSEAGLPTKGERFKKIVQDYVTENYPNIADNSESYQKKLDILKSHFIGKKVNNVQKVLKLYNLQLRIEYKDGRIQENFSNSSESTVHVSVVSGKITEIFAIGTREYSAIQNSI